MKQTSTFYSTAFVSAMAAYLVACGGGGGDTYAPDTGMVEEPYTLARFEFARGHCQFDNERMREIAAAKYPGEYAQCKSTYTGNRRISDRAPWPNSKSWPSTPDLGGAS